MLTRRTRLHQSKGWPSKEEKTPLVRVCVCISVALAQSRDGVQPSELWLYAAPISL
jgi:hypothetical protein